MRTASFPQQGRPLSLIEVKRNETVPKTIWPHEDVNERISFSAVFLEVTWKHIKFFTLKVNNYYLQDWKQLGGKTAWGENISATESMVGIFNALGSWIPTENLGSSDTSKSLNGTDRL